MSKVFLEKMRLFRLLAFVGIWGFLKPHATCEIHPRRSESREEFYDLFKQFRSYAQPTHELVLLDRRTELLYGGSVKVDYYAARHATTLNKEFVDDVVDQFRQRSEATLVIKQKMDPYRDLPVVEGRITLGNVIFWRTTYPARNPSFGSALQDYDLIFPPVRANMQEAWVKLNVDQLFSNNEPMAFTIKCGLFPFLVGRGISLGDWYSGGSSVYGFTNMGVEAHAPKFPPGVLVSGNVVRNVLGYDLYFSPAVSEELTSTNINSDYLLSTPLDNLSDRHIVAGRLRILGEGLAKGRAYLEPYFVFYNSPRNTARTALDSPLKFLTLGVMLDFKASGFSFNIEAARQFGRQRVHECVFTGRPNTDKFVSKDAATGRMSFTETTSPRPNLLAPTTDTTKVLDPATGNYYQALPNSYDEWKNYTYTTGLPNYYQYHPGYEFDLAGRMLVCDMKYTLQDSLQLAAAFGYFSGDTYPYNDAVDNYYVGNSTSSLLQPTKGVQNNFLPLRDYHYTGLWSSPMVMFNSGLVPRPYNLNYTRLVTNNEVTAATNIKYLCFGFTVSPIGNLAKFSVNPNVCIYWNDCKLPVWDKTAIKPDLILMEENYEYANAPLAAEGSTNKLFERINGWEGYSVASTNLGWELNCLASYAITERLELKVKAGVFFPGKLYADIEGQPNAQTLRYISTVNNDGTSTGYFQNKGLGKDIAYGVDVRLGYNF